jgi:hypothetical protein
MLTVSRRPGRAGVGRHRSLAFGRRDPGRRHGHACGRTDIELSPTDQRSVRALRFLDALRYSEKQRIGESFPASRRASRNCPLWVYRSAIQVLVRHRVIRTIFANPRSQTFGRLSPAKYNGSLDPVLVFPSPVTSLPRTSSLTATARSTPADADGRIRGHGCYSSGILSGGYTDLYTTSPQPLIASIRNLPRTLRGRPPGP